MKKIIILLSFLQLASVKINAQQRVVAECTINYSVATDSSSAKTNNALSSTKKTVYIKGNDSRTDIVSPSFSQTTFYDKTSGNAVVLREFGNNKIMTKLSKSQWLETNKKFEGITVNLLSDTKTILGYECKKAILQTKDGNLVNVFYATAIMPSVKEFEYEFRDIPGLVLEYETEKDGQKIKFTAIKINLSPVQNSKFDVPTTGYLIRN